VLDADLRDARLKTWLVVAASTLAMGALLFRIVLSGSRTIETQQATLQKRLNAMQTMAEQNRALRLHIQAASGRASSLNERYLRRISADLHDGPAQNLAVAALRLPRLALLEGEQKQAEVAEIRAVLDTAMQEIRGISRGLILPELENMALPALLDRVTGSHESRTQSTVTLETENIENLALDHPQNICVYRFVQEGLTNAFKHGGGIDQRVRASVTSNTLTVRVSDNGTAIPQATEGSGLGRIGLRERVESLGGTFASTDKSITMTLNLEET
jgi:signal transduction histidine kinase